MNDIYTGEFVINNYLIFPRSMLKLGLNATEAAVYMLLLDRAKLSAQKGGWTDEMGYVYLFYPILSLARDLDRGETAVRTALQSLEQRDLICRRRQGRGKPNRLYVKLPREEPSAALQKKRRTEEDEARDRISREFFDARYPSP